MTKCSVRRSLFLIGCALAALAAGCATTADRKVNLAYEPAVHAVGGSGELYLARQAGTGGTNQPVQWVIGTIKDSDGNKVGSVVTDTLPADLVVQAFSAELKAAGYTVIPVAEIPSGAAKGITLENAAVALDEVTSLVKVEGRSSVKATAEIWKNGTVVGKLLYETADSDTTVTHRETFPQEMLQKSLQNLMQRAVPELIKSLEQK